MAFAHALAEGTRRVAASPSNLSARRTILVLHRWGMRLGPLHAFKSGLRDPLPICESSKGTRGLQGYAHCSLKGHSGSDSKHW